MGRVRSKKKTSSVRIGRELHTQLKTIAANEKTTLQKVVGRACRDLVKLKETEETKNEAFSSPNPPYPKEK